MEMHNRQGVAKFFEGRSIFITGGTGFMCKILVEKLLRSCPGVKKIYVLVRTGNNGAKIKGRLKKTTSQLIFDKLKRERPGHLESKLVFIKGDITEPGLGLSVKDRNMLLKKVSIVYQVGASVRCNQSFKKAIIMNVRGTRDVCQLVREMRQNHPETFFMHVSTAYSNIDNYRIEERIHPAQANWQHCIQLAESLDEHLMQIIMSKYIEGYLNAYGFTKALGEQVVNDMFRLEGTKTAILRPSVVTSTLSEPEVGWTDNLNGPTGMIAASNIGITRITYMQPDISSDFIPVDCVIRYMINITWKQGTEKYFVFIFIFITRNQIMRLLSVFHTDELLYIKAILWAKQNVISNIYEKWTIGNCFRIEVIFLITSGI